MAEGFSDPDPADEQPGIPDPKPREEVDHELNAVIDTGEGVLAVDKEASCVRCAKFDVCSIFQGFASMINSEWGESSDGAQQDPPVDPEKLAMHCTEYEPVQSREDALAEKTEQ